MGFYEDWIEEEKALFPPKKKDAAGTSQAGSGTAGSGAAVNGGAVGSGKKKDAGRTRDSAGGKFAGGSRKKDGFGDGELTKNTRTGGGDQTWRSPFPGTADIRSEGGGDEWSAKDYDDFRTAFNGKDEKKSAFGSFENTKVETPKETVDRIFSAPGMPGMGNIFGDRWGEKEYRDFREGFVDDKEKTKFSVDKNFGTTKAPTVQDVIDRAFGNNDSSYEMKFINGKWMKMPKLLFGEEGAVMEEAPGSNVDIGKTDDSTRQAIKKYVGQGMDDFYSKSSGVAKEDNTRENDFGDNLTEEQILRFSLEDQTTDDIQSPYGEGVASLLSQWKKQMMKDHDTKTRVKVDPVIQGLQLLESKVMPEYFPAPQIQTFNVDGKTVWMDVANEPGIGFLSDGQMVIGNRDKEATINNYLKWVNKRYSTDEEAQRAGEKDYSIVDITNWLNQFMDKRAEQFKDVGKLPELQKYFLFKDKVKAQSSGDLKLYPEIKKHELFIYDGEIVNRDALGNIAFGHLGKQFGIPDDILTAAAGVAQILAKTSDWRWGLTAFDDPRDARRVRQGIDRWRDQQER